MRFSRLSVSIVVLLVAAACSQAPVANRGVAVSPAAVGTGTTPSHGEQYCGQAIEDPWGLTFCSSGDLIKKGPSSFCDVFACIPEFWLGPGYMVQCADGLFSHSGGYGGACYFHRGIKHILYSSRPTHSAGATSPR
jgi:hypothetical protein